MSCTHEATDAGWMCPHVYEGLTDGRSVSITVCDVGGVACEAYCPHCRRRLDTFDLESEDGLEAAFDKLRMVQMCLDCFRGLIRSASEFDEKTMDLS